MDEAKYSKILATFIVRKGVPMKAHDNGYWGAGYAEAWEAIRRHMSGCEIKSHRDLDDEFTWTTFGGTFASHDPVQKGMQVRITCACGEIVDQLYRYEGHLGTAIRDFIEVMDIMLDDK